MTKLLYDKKECVVKKYVKNVWEITAESLSRTCVQNGCHKKDSMQLE